MQIGSQPAVLLAVRHVLEFECESIKSFTVIPCVCHEDKNIKKSITHSFKCLQIQVSVHLHHWKTAMDLLKDEEERKKQTEEAENA